MTTFVLYQLHLVEAAEDFSLRREIFAGIASPDDIRRVMQTDGYRRIATIVTDSLDDVFQLTNHIDYDWTTNPQIREMHIEEGLTPRSTSVGDVIMIGDLDHPDDFDERRGDMFVVAPSGFTKLGNFAEIMV